MVLVSVGKNQIRIGSDFWELVAELEPEIFNFLRTGSGTRFPIPFMYGTRTKIFGKKTTRTRG